MSACRPRKRAEFSVGKNIPQVEKATKSQDGMRVVRSNAWHRSNSRSGRFWPEAACLLLRFEAGKADFQRARP
jgi:hypothetical protein